MSLSRSIIITGGNAGLGFETAKAVARDRATLAVVACRNPESGQAAARRLGADGGKAAFLPLDLGVLASVRQSVQLFREERLPPLFGIVCNAGMQNVGTPQKTVDGYETTFAVNHLGHYLLVRLLLDNLQPDGRVTFVSSGTHDPKQRTGMPPPVYNDANLAAHDFEATRTAGLRRYTTSKLCNILCTYELSRRLADAGDVRLKSIKVNAIDPGLMPATGLARSWPKHLQWISRNVLPLARLISNNVHNPRTSGNRVASLTTGPAATPGGRYFSNGKAVHSSEQSYDRGVQGELWVSSAKMTGLPAELRLSAAGTSLTSQPGYQLPSGLPH